MTYPPDVDWNEARLLVLRELDRLANEQTRQAGILATAQDKLEGRLTKDLNEAHKKIRALESGQKRIEREIWQDRVKVAALSSSVTGVVFLVLKVLWPLMLRML